MNYGGLGVVIGHEINHGFDNTGKFFIDMWISVYNTAYNINVRFAGRKYDKNGNAIEWWTQETINKYEELAQCFVNQYNSYLVPGLEENIYVSSRA